MAQQQRGMGTSPWDNAVAAPRQVANPSGFDAMTGFDCGSAAGTGVTNGNQGYQQSGWDMQVERMPEVPTGSNLKPGDGGRTGGAMPDAGTMAREAASAGMADTPGGTMRGAGNLGVRKEAVPRTLDVTQGDNRTPASTRRGQDMSRPRRP